MLKLFSSDHGKLYVGKLHKDVHRITHMILWMVVLHFTIGTVSWCQVYVSQLRKRYVILIDTVVLHAQRNNGESGRELLQYAQLSVWLYWLDYAVAISRLSCYSVQ